MDDLNVEQTYDAERASWIEKHGSRRLRLAAERGYKHDGIYRDERLEVDLPGFRYLGNKVKVRELINPTEDALDEELTAMERADRLRLGGEIRLVWVQDSAESDQGAAVQFAGYLGKHTVFLMVGEEI